MMGSYLTFNRYLKNKFGEKVYKIPVDAGFDCPNIDGRAGRGGCIYCRNAAFRPFYIDREDSIEEQIEKGRKIFRRKNAEKFLIYFQTHTNTYLPVAELKKLYDRALVFDDVVGLCVGTRPDCLPEEVVDLLGTYAHEGKEIWIEIGQQSANPASLQRINRGHGFEDYVSAVEKIRKWPELKLCTHIIFGLPGEDEKMMKKSLDEILAVGLDAIKFHHLHVVRGTVLALEYERGDYRPISYELYKKMVVWALKKLPKNVVVQRLIGNAPDELLLAPRWKKTKQEFIGEVEKELARE